MLFPNQQESSRPDLADSSFSVKQIDEDQYEVTRYPRIPTSGMPLELPLHDRRFIADAYLPLIGKPADKDDKYLRRMELPDHVFMTSGGDTTPDIRFVHVTKYKRSEVPILELKNRFMSSISGFCVHSFLTVVTLGGYIWYVYSQAKKREKILDRIFYQKPTE